MHDFPDFLVDLQLAGSNCGLTASLLMAEAPAHLAPQPTVLSCHHIVTRLFYWNHSCLAGSVAPPKHADDAQLLLRRTGCLCCHNGHFAYLCFLFHWSLRLLCLLFHLLLRLLILLLLWLVRLLFSVAALLKTCNQEEQARLSTKLCELCSASTSQAKCLRGRGRAKLKELCTEPGMLFLAACLQWNA